MKKRTGILLALILCLGLTTTAFAADGYAPYTFEGHQWQIKFVDNRYGYAEYSVPVVIQFEAAKVKQQTSIVFHTDGSKEPQNVLVILVKPDSEVTVETPMTTQTDIGNMGTVNLTKDNMPVYIMWDTAESPAVSAFSDVKASDWFAPYIKWAVENRVTSGTSPNTFSPDKECTRAEILTFLWNQAGAPVLDQDCPYTDVADDSWYHDAAVWVAAKGLADDSMLAPDQLCTRLMAVDFMWRLHGKDTSAPAAGFSDVVSNAAVNWAVSTGITGGTSGATFSPDSVCNRAQIVTFLYNLSNQG